MKWRKIIEIPRTQHVREEAEIRNRSKSVTKQGKKAVGRSRERGTDHTTMWKVPQSKTQIIIIILIIIIKLIAKRHFTQKTCLKLENYNVIKLPAGFYVYRHVKKDGTVTSVQKKINIKISMAETSQRFRASCVRKAYIATGLRTLYLKNYLF